METYVVFRDHLYGNYFTALKSDVEAYDIMALEDENSYMGYYGYCDQCYDSDHEVGELILDHEPSQDEIEEFVRENE